MEKHNKILWLCRTALMLALLVGLQWATAGTQAFAGQYITGSLVNCVLAVTAMLLGLGAGLAVALVSPVMAYLLGIAPQLVVVPAIMAGNSIFVVFLRLYSRRTADLLSLAVGVATAAVGKFALLYLLVGKIICGVAADALMGLRVGGAPVLAPKMLALLTAKFSWPQLVTALVGGGLALAVFPFVKSALKKDKT